MVTVGYRTLILCYWKGSKNSLLAAKYDVMILKDDKKLETKIVGYVKNHFLGNILLQTTLKWSILFRSKSSFSFENFSESIEYADIGKKYYRYPQDGFQRPEH